MIMLPMARTLTNTQDHIHLNQLPATNQNGTGHPQVAAGVIATAEKIMITAGHEIFHSREFLTMNTKAILQITAIHPIDMAEITDHTSIHTMMSALRTAVIIVLTMTIMK